MEKTRDPHPHAARIKAQLAETAQHIREDLVRVDDLQAKALFETTREVLAGLVKAFEHYQAGAPAWKPGASPPSGA